MIILGKGRKDGISSIISKKLSGSDYDSLKSENESMTHSKYEESNEPEELEACVSKLVQAVGSGNTAEVKEQLVKIIKMVK